jgi:N-acetylneuraminic acid mutarotase
MGEGALDDFFSFDTVTGTWEQIRTETGPPARSYHAMASSAKTGKVYVFGGCGAGSSGRLNDLWEFDPAVGAWTALPTFSDIKVCPRSPRAQVQGLQTLCHQRQLETGFGNNWVYVV